MDGDCEMIFENEYGKVDFWDKFPKLNEKEWRVAMNLSGGVDSAFVLFMLCTYLTETGKNNQVNFITGVEHQRPTNEWHAREIGLYMKERFPHLNWGWHEFFYYDNRRITGRAKTEEHRENEHRIQKEVGYDLLLGGRTANPPDVRELEKGRELIRDLPKDSEHPEYNGTRFYVPLQNVHKKWVAKMYEHYGLMDDLYPLTASCIGNAYVTDHFTKPCRTCWWCREKFWAFGSYDGGVT